MERVIEIFKQLQNTSSKNDKVAIIKANSENELFKECLKFLFDTNIVTGLSDAKINKQFNKNNRVPCLFRFTDVMKYLKNNNTGTDYDIEAVQNFIKRQPNEYQEIYKQLVTKSLRLGCDEKSINKALPNLIPTFDVMLGTSIDKCKIPNNTWFSLSRKLNGNRISWVGNRFLTRQGKEYIGLDHIKNDLMSLGYANMFVDGELVYKNKESLSDSEAFQIGTGIANSKAKKKEELKLIVFDVFPLNEFWQGKSKDTYKKRIKNLDELSTKINNNKIENIECVERLYEGTDQSKIWELLDFAEESDWEGLMLNLDTVYECKRTKNLVKIKKFNESDLRCIDIEEGQGKNKGTLGAIIVDYKGNIVNCGSGFTDEQRNYYWNNPSEIIGKIVTVKYKEETKNKNGGISIQFPVFQCVREDKTEPSYN